MEIIFKKLYNYISRVINGGDNMINLVKKENINLGILETDFDIFTDIVNTFPNETLKQDCILDLDDYILPDYFKSKMTIVIQSNDMLVGYVIFEFKNVNSGSQVEIDNLYVREEFKNKLMDALLVEAVIYVSGEVGARNVIVKVDDKDRDLFNMYESIGFYEISMNEHSSTLIVNVSSYISTRKLNDKFRDIEDDAIDYKSLKLVNKIASGRSGNIYLTSDNRILKMFTSTSFTYIKDREETLRYIKKLDVAEVAKPKNLVYYDGIFIGYIMEYLPEGSDLLTKCKSYTFEEKLEKINKLEKVMKKLHKQKIYICDLNPNNMYLDNNGNIKLIDCDAFVTKRNILNNSVVKKYQDPIYKIVGKKTDMYAFAITCLEILTDEVIDDNASLQDIEKVYNKNKNKLPVSFKTYFEGIFKTKERFYLSDSYENYINDIYNVDNITNIEDKKGNISVIILSIILLVITIVGYVVFKFKING